MTVRFIDLVEPKTGRTSALQIEGDVLTVIGVLDHGSSVRPCRHEDARRLVKWLAREYQLHGDIVDPVKRDAAANRRALDQDESS